MLELGEACVQYAAWIQEGFEGEYYKDFLLLFFSKWSNMLVNEMSFFFFYHDQHCPERAFRATRGQCRAAFWSASQNPALRGTLLDRSACLLQLSALLATLESQCSPGAQQAPGEELNAQPEAAQPAIRAKGKEWVSNLCSRVWGKGTFQCKI